MARDVGEISAVPGLPSPFPAVGFAVAKLEQALKLLARRLHERGKLNLAEAFVVHLRERKKRASLSAQPVAAKDEDHRCRRWSQ